MLFAKRKDCDGYCMLTCGNLSIISCATLSITRAWNTAIFPRLPINIFYFTNPCFIFYKWDAFMWDLKENTKHIIPLTVMTGWCLDLTDSRCLKLLLCSPPIHHSQDWRVAEMYSENYFEFSFLILHGSNSLDSLWQWAWTLVTSPLTFSPPLFWRFCTPNVVVV